MSSPHGKSNSLRHSHSYVNGTRPTLIRNATIWTGEPIHGSNLQDIRSGKGFAWISSDIFLNNGLIQRSEPSINVASLPSNSDIINADGHPVTAGIIDMHSHAGVGALPGLRGNNDDNELSDDITPYVRSIDGFDPLDHQIQVIKSGGVTTSLILPGSGNNMGGEAYVVKHAVGKADGRPEISAQDMLANPEGGLRWMKMACGENAKRVYGKIGRGPFSRMGESWAFRHAFEQAQALVQVQDDWCTAADAGGIKNMKEYLPQDLQWESLSAVLRGQVYVNTHCYTVPDLEAFIDHTNEFHFPIRAFHHAHQTYLVPEILKRAWGGRPPAAALFADNMYYKAEAYTASEQAGKILYENGITPVYVSDNPVLNAQHVVFEAAKAYGYGLPYHAALNGVTSAPGELLGLGERIGKIKEGFDADVVLWDSDPLSVGAAPRQVWIDGIAQFKDPYLLEKATPTPVTSAANSKTEVYDPSTTGDVIFTGVTRVKLPNQVLSFSIDTPGNLIVSDGKIICLESCVQELQELTSVTKTHLNNGHITSPLLVFGSPLGLVEIDGEPDTQDGTNPSDAAVFSRAVDGLALDGKQIAAAFSHGVTRAISAPRLGGGSRRGISAGFLTSVANTAEKGAIWANEVAVHYPLTLDVKEQPKTPSISTAVGALRQSLLNALDKSKESPPDAYSEAAYIKRVVNGKLPLVLDIHAVDNIAAVLRVKNEVESASGQPLRVIIYGGAESHILASELASANVGVILSPFLSYREDWEQRRALTGAPLTNGTAVDVLLREGVMVGIGVEEGWEARNLRLMAAWAYRNGGEEISEEEAWGLAGGNILKMVGLDEEAEDGIRPGGSEEWVAWEGNPLVDITAKVRAQLDFTTLLRYLGLDNCDVPDSPSVSELRMDNILSLTWHQRVSPRVLGPMAIALAMTSDSDLLSIYCQHITATITLVPPFHTMFVKIGLLLFAACAAPLPGVFAAPTSNEVAVPRDDNILFPPHLWCGTHTSHCEDEELNYHCDDKHHVVYDKKDPSCDACHCGPQIIQHERDERQSINSPDVAPKKPRDEVNAKQVGGIEAIEARNDQSISTREDQSLDTRDTQFLDLHLDCGSAPRTLECTSDPYWYFCTFAGVERKTNRISLMCQNNCECLDKQNNLYTPSFMPVNAWSPIGPIKHDDNKSDQNSTKKIRNEEAAIEARNEDALKGRNGDALKARNEDALKTRNEDALTARNEGALEARDEQSISARDEQWINLHVVCVSDMVTRICTSDPFLYYCTYQGLQHKTNRIDMNCERDCECYDQNNKPYIPAFVPLSPWGDPIPLKAAEDPGQGNTVPDAL
ncbi:MAG: hypothetical protein Q9160_008397 [Pyrenula sp. 1 TL-2023]